MVELGFEPRHPGFRALVIERRPEHLKRSLREVLGVERLAGRARSRALR